MTFLAQDGETKPLAIGKNENTTLISRHLTNGVSVAMVVVFPILSGPKSDDV